MRLRAQRKERRRGVAAVEMAAVAAFLIFLGLGMFEVTFAIQAKGRLNEAARAGCRLAAGPGHGNADVSARIQQVLSEYGYASQDITTTTKVNGQTADVATARKYDSVQVKISVPMSKIYTFTPILFIGQTVESEALVMMRQG